MDPRDSIFRPDLLQDRVVLVTGGGTGLGHAMSLAFAAHGADVAVLSRNLDHLEPVVEEVEGMGRRGYAHAADVRDPEAVEAAVAGAEDALGPLDVLVNNAAGNFITPFEEMSANGFSAVVDIVLKGTANVTRAVGSRMLEREEGAVLNLVATYAWGAAPYVSHSGAGKAGVLNLTRSLAVEWAPRNVRVNAIAPGPIDTPGARKQLWADPDQKARLESTIPLGRFGGPDEVAQAALYLASPAASYITGECLTIDGGQWLVGGLFQDTD